MDVTSANGGAVIAIIDPAITQASTTIMAKERLLESDPIVSNNENNTH